MTLQYLEFDYAEDTDGIGTFEAMASVGPEHVQAVLGEMTQVLAWAFEHFGEAHGPLEDGFAWDHDLQGQQEFTLEEVLHFDERNSRVVVQQHAPGVPRHTYTLSISGSPDFCDALRARFDLG